MMRVTLFVFLLLLVFKEILFKNLMMYSSRHLDLPLLGGGAAEFQHESTQKGNRETVRQRGLSVHEP